jgi:hypothetical protein
MRILVCGGRSYWNRERVYEVLDELHDGTITCVITGGAPGADGLAMQWAQARGVQLDLHYADWKEHGKAAGPIRNQRMLDEGSVDLVVAFPGGVGTADMVRRARERGVQVLDVAEKSGVMLGLKVVSPHGARVTETEVVLSRAGKAALHLTDLPPGELARKEVKA